MNIEHIDQAIAVMKRAKLHRKHFNMRYFQNNERYNQPEEIKIAKTESELHECGNTACFAGWVAISPEWKAFGGIVGIDGYPDLADYQKENVPSFDYISYQAIAIWLDIRYNLAYDLIVGDLDMAGFSTFYKKLFEQVTPEDVIAKLEMIKSSQLK